MREIKEIIARIPFDDYDRFDTPPTVLKSKGDINGVAEKELIVGEGLDDSLYIKKEGEIKQVSSGSSTSTQGEKGDKGDTGATGADGASSYTYIAYASDASGTGFTLTFNSTLDYIAILTTTTEIVSPVASDFAGLWKNYKGQKGDDGTDGTNGTNGTNGQGVPTGGTVGQVLKKKSSTDFDTEWATITLGGALTVLYAISSYVKSTVSITGALSCSPSIRTS